MEEAKEFDVTFKREQYVTLRVKAEDSNAATDIAFAKVMEGEGEWTDPENDYVDFVETIEV